MFSTTCRRVDSGRFRFSIEGLSEGIAKEETIWSDEGKRATQFNSEITIWVDKKQQPIKIFVRCITRRPISE